MESAIELVGAVLILSAFTLAQVGRLSTGSLAYLGLNLAGAATLAVVAVIDGDVGFVLLEGVWSIVSAVALVRLAMHRGRRSP